ncbi:MAG: FTR1 family protein, partial [Synechococcales cyanobacterium]
MDFTFALPVFLVTLREGVEAALVIGIVLACLSKANASSLNRFVYIGVALGVTVSVALGLCLVISLQSLGLSDWNYAPVVEQAVKGGVALVAIALLSWMLVWMTQQAKTLKHEVIQSVEASLNGGHGWGIFTLIFVAVLREGVET